MNIHKLSTAFQESVCQMNAPHYSDVIMGAMASKITIPTIAYSAVYQAQIKENIKASLAFVRAIHRWPMNSPHKWPVTRKMFPFDHIIRCTQHPINTPQTLRCYYVKIKLFKADLFLLYRSFNVFIILPWESSLNLTKTSWHGNTICNTCLLGGDPAGFHSRMPQ